VLAKIEALIDLDDTPEGGKPDLLLCRLKTGKPNGKTSPPLPRLKDSGFGWGRKAKNL
jgi:hypothetical protein